MRFVVLPALVALQVLTAQPTSPALVIEPSPVSDCENGLGRATLRWSDLFHPFVQVRIGSAQGAAVTGVEPSNGSATTDYWISDGTVFVLVDPMTGTEIAQAMARVSCALGRAIVRAAPRGDSYLPLQIGNQWVYRLKSRLYQNLYETWRIDRTETIEGRKYYRLSVQGSSLLLRADSEGRYYAWTSGRDELWLDTTSAPEPSTQCRVSRKVASVSSDLGVFDDAIRCERGGLLLETSFFARGVGLVSQTSTMLTGSSGGFSSGMQLVEARLAGGAVVLEAPRESLELGIESRSLDVSGHKVTNCAVPCYFVACFLAPGADPPDTYKPCAAARVRIVGRANGTLTLSLHDASQREWSTASIPVDAEAKDQVRLHQVALYAKPNEPVPPGVYELTATLDGFARSSVILDIR